MYIYDILYAQMPYDNSFLYFPNDEEAQNFLA